MTLLEIKARQKAILDEIRVLEKEHGVSVHDTNSCSACKQIRMLGIEYEDLTLERRREKLRQDPLESMYVRTIFAKGEYATRKEVAYLLEQGWPINKVAVRLGMSPTRLHNQCRAWGLKSRWKQGCLEMNRHGLG